MLILLAGGPVTVLLAAGSEPEVEEVIELSSLEVNADATEATLDFQAAGVDIIQLESTNRALLGSLGEAIAWEPGVSSSFYGAGASRPVLRGMEGYRVGVLGGGLSSGDLSAGSPDHAVTIEPLFIRSVTIHRGAAALLHGGSAIGGAVDTEPDYLPQSDMPEAHEGVLGLALESVNKGSTAWLKAGHRQDSFAVRVNLLARETDDYNIPGMARTEDYDINNRIRLPPEVQGLVAPNPHGTVPNTGTRSLIGALGAGWLKDAWQLRGAYQRYQSEYGVPVDGHTHGNPFGTPGVNGPNVGDGVTIELVQDRIVADAIFNLEGDAFKSLSFKSALTWYGQQEYEGRFLANDFALDSTEIQAEARLATGQIEMYLGLSASTHKYHNRNISYIAGRPDEDNLETDSIASAAFALVELPLGRSALRVGARIENQDAKRSDLTGYQRNDTTHSFVAEVVYPFFDHWQFVLAAGRTSRIPNAEELYIEAPHGATGVFQIPNPELEPEFANSAELRLERHANPFDLSVSAFYRQFEGFIFMENQGFEVDGLTAYAFVQHDARFIGGELSVDTTLFESGNKTLEMNLFADYVWAEDIRNEEPLPRIPPLRAGGSLHGDWGGWSAGLQVLHAFSQNRVPREVFGTLSYQSPSEAYTLVTLQLERSIDVLNRELRVTLQGSNLLDQEARQHTSFLKDVAPLPGRSVMLSFVAEF